jgi:hypothetical protein
MNEENRERTAVKIIFFFLTEKKERREEVRAFETFLFVPSSGMILCPNSFRDIYAFSVHVGINVSVLVCDHVVVVTVAIDVIIAVVTVFAVAVDVNVVVSVDNIAVVVIVDVDVNAVLDVGFDAVVVVNVGISCSYFKSLFLLKQIILFLLFSKVHAIKKCSTILGFE